MLRKAGISARALQNLFCEPGEDAKTADVLLDMAKECQCRTVVVGRRSASWLHELFSQDLSEEVLRRAATQIASMISCGVAPASLLLSCGL